MPDFAQGALSREKPVKHLRKSYLAVEPMTLEERRWSEDTGGTV
jgi:hypothetical protein